MNAARHIGRNELGLFYAFAALALVSVLLAFALNITFLIAVPALLLVVAFTLTDYKSVYFLLMAMLPCSIEYYFPNGLATDLPTEPLMAGLMMITFALLALRKNVLPRGFLSHPLIALLLLHLFWIFFCALNSGKPVFSFKTFLAKLWYIAPFTFLTAIVMRKGRDLKIFFWCVFTPLTVLIIVSLLRHGILYHFSFQDANHSVAPYFRNHVNYAAMISVFFPFLLLAAGWYKGGSNMRRMLYLAIALYVVATYFSYTRTAMLALLGMVPFYFIIRYRMAKLTIAALTVVMIAGISWLFYDNHYLRFAPNFEETIYHDDFGSHLSSTFEGKDVSGMERIYRWVAAARMVHDRPLTGVGSGNFYNYYRPYTVSDFETYVSDNEEQSTVHNYFLLMLAEQGWPGLIIFLLLIFSSVIYGEYIYVKMNNSADRHAVMVLLLVMFSIIINLLLSDMLETDKVGPFFFMDLALLALFDLKVLSMKTDSE